MKKKITAICLIVALAAVAIVGGTLAFFTDTDDVTNTFTVGNVAITLDEAPVLVDEETGDYIPNEEADRVQENKYENIFPGQTLAKDPTVTNVGSYDAYVKVDVTIPNVALTAFGAGEAPYDAFKQIALGGDVMDAGTERYSASAASDNGIADGLTDGDYLLTFEVGEENTVFTVYILDPMAPTDDVVIFEKIVVPATLTNEDFADLGEEGEFTMGLVAYAIQADGFADADAAFEALDAALAPVVEEN